MSTFGGQTVTFVSVTENPAVRDRYNKPEKVRTEVDVTGCRFRPLSGEEAQALGDISEAVWKGTIPPVGVALAARVGDEVIENGVTYQIDQPPKPYRDMSGAMFKCTIFCKRVTG